MPSVASAKEGGRSRLSLVSWIALAAFGLPVVYVMFAFNRFVAYRNERVRSWSQIEVQLARRHDLIPKLVEVVRGHMKFEKELLESVVRARASAMRARESGQSIRATRLSSSKSEGRLSVLVGDLLAAWEKYPDLKSNRHALELQRELSSTENKIAYARGHYNDIVANYNALVEGLPSNLVAALFGFREHEFFRLPEGETA